MILVIDNYDSFTYNIVQALQRLGNEEVQTIRSKEITVSEIEAMNPSHIVIGPGPGTPSDAGVSVEAIKYFAGKIPILGICLGHQAIGQACLLTPLRKRQSNSWKPSVQWRDEDSMMLGVRCENCSSKAHLPRRC